MPFPYNKLTGPYDRVTGPIDREKASYDRENDSEAVHRCKETADDLVYGLVDAGWQREQIEAKLRAHFDAVSAVLAEHQRDYIDRQQYTDAFRVIAQVLVDQIAPEGA